MVLPEPVAETVTFFPETGLPLASFKVTVIVAPVVLSTDKDVGETKIVDVVADTGPVKVTETVLVKAMLSVVSVAETVLAPASNDFMVAVV